ncbi:MAG TPA: MFS transporter [Thermoprotei archaeon]|nr:MFS transporter [Thermoprotei archaeon]
MKHEGDAAPLLEKKKISEPLRILYIRQIVTAFSNGFASPFVSILMVQLNASAFMLGLLSSLTNFISNFFQFMWGAVTDAVGRKVPFIVIGGLSTSFIWLLAIGTKQAQFLLLLVALQSFMNSMVTPALSALIGDLAPPMRRGRISASLNIFSSLGSLVATLISGYIMMVDDKSLTFMYLFPFLLAAITGFVGNLVILKIREKPTRRKVSARPSELIKPLRENPTFRKFAEISFASMIIQSLPWGVFPFVIVDVVRANMIQVALISVINGLFILSVQRIAGNLVDRVGRKPFILVGKFGLATFPLFYAFATSVTYLYLGNAIGGAFNGLLMVASFAYMLDVSPNDMRGEYFGVYNSLMGIGTGIGALIGGSLADIFMSHLGLVMGLRYVLLIFAIGRFSVNFLFFKIKEPSRLIEDKRRSTL